jgi:hypothetical protein
LEITVKIQPGGSRRLVRRRKTRAKFRFFLYIVAKLNVFGIKFKTAGIDQNPLFLDLFIIAKKNAITHPSAMPAGKQTGSQLK